MKDDDDGDDDDNDDDDDGDDDDDDDEDDDDDDGADDGVDFDDGAFLISRTAINDMLIDCNLLSLTRTRKMRNDTNESTAHVKSSV